MSYNKARIYLRTDPYVCLKEVWELLVDEEIDREEYDKLVKLARLALEKIKGRDLSGKDMSELYSIYKKLHIHPDPLVKLRIMEKEEAIPELEELRQETLRNDRLNWNKIAKLARIAGIAMMKAVEWRAGVYIDYTKELEKLKICDAVLAKCIEEPQAYEKFY